MSPLKRACIMSFNGFDWMYILLPTIVSSNLSITHKIPNDTQWINILPHTILLLWRQLRLLLFICKMASSADSCSEFSKKPRTKDSFVPFLFCFVPAIFLSLSFANTENSEEKNFCISLGFFVLSLCVSLALSLPFILSTFSLFTLMEKYARDGG